MEGKDGCFSRFVRLLLLMQGSTQMERLTSCMQRIVEDELEVVHVADPSLPEAAVKFRRNVIRTFTPKLQAKHCRKHSVIVMFCAIFNSDWRLIETKHSIYVPLAVAKIFRSRCTNVSSPWPSKINKANWLEWDRAFNGIMLLSFSHDVLGRACRDAFETRVEDSCVQYP